MKQFLAAVAFASLANFGGALPLLQLDVAGGTYNDTTQSISVTANSFNLYALLNSKTPAGPYYITAALTETMADGSLQPLAASSPTPDLGAFTFGGVAVDAAAGMNYGTPYLMPAHGIYPTYYSQFSFNFTGAAGPSSAGPPQIIGVAPTATGLTTMYNSQDTGHVDLTHSPSGNGMFAMFSVDITQLELGTTVVFDLFTYTGTGAKVKIRKAPFSHNAEGTPTAHVPDGGKTLVLLGLAVTVLAIAPRRLMR